MTISQIEYFIAVQRFGSINKAAEKLHTSAQTISSGIKSLENDLGYPLFIRNGKQSMSLSCYGEIFIETADDILKALAQSRRKMQNISAQNAKKHTTESLKIYASPAINLDILPSVLQKFSQNHPYIKLQTSHEETPAIFSILPEQNSMAVFVSFDPLSNTEHILYRQLFIDKVYALFNTRHPLAQQKTISISSILRYPLAILQSSSSYANPLCAILEEHGKPDYRIITTNINVYEKFIADNQAIGFITKSSLKKHTPLLQLIASNISVPIKNMPPIYVYLGVGRQYYENHRKSIGDFIDICQSLV